MPAAETPGKKLARLRKHVKLAWGVSLEYFLANASRIREEASLSDREDFRRTYAELSSLPLEADPATNKFRIARRRR